MISSKSAHSMPLGPYDLVVHDTQHVNQEDELSVVIEETGLGKLTHYKVYKESDPANLLYTVSYDGSYKKIPILENGTQEVASFESGLWGERAKTVKGLGDISYLFELKSGLVKKKVRAVVNNQTSGMPVDVNYKTITGNGEIYVQQARDVRRVIAEVTVTGAVFQKYTVRVAKGVDVLLLVTLILQHEFWMKKFNIPGP
ncbi:hypothetical protein BJ742DRAFT_817703 [Cladochytrium replicatum]|nr:hypothetical protein BJ742DRAFT_817703 [Cladochytrium replicatum]